MLTLDHALARPGARTTHALAPILAVVALIAAVGVAAGVATNLTALVVLAALLGAVVFVVAVLAWPDIATLAVLLLIYTNAPVVGAQFHGVPYLVAALVPALLLVPILDRLVFGAGSLVLPPTLPYIGAFVLVEILSTLLSADPAAASVELFRVLTEGLLLYLLVVNAVRTVPLLRLAMVGLVLAGAALASLSVVQILAAPDADFFGFAQIEGRGFAAAEDAAIQPRANGPIGEKNFYAQMLLALLPLAAALWRGGGARMRLLAGASGAVITLGIVLTFSRGAAVAAGILVLAAVGLRMVRPRVVAQLALVAVLAVALVPNYAARLSTLTGIGGALEVTEDVDPVLAQRANDILAATAAFADHPFLGVGPGMFQANYREYATRVAGLPGDLDYAAHNLYLEIASETGVLGLLAFGGVIGMTLLLLVRARRAAAAEPSLVAMADGFILVVVSYLATGLFLHVSYQRYIWLFLALACAAALVIRERVAPTPGDGGGSP